MNRLILLLALTIILPACEGGGDSPDLRAAPTTDFGPTIPGDDILDPVDPTDPTTLQVTYYSLSRTEAPINGWPQRTYTATGSCAEIEEKTYCWSDGLKTLTWTHNNFTYGPFHYNYFSLHTSNNSPNSCYGGCQDDYMQGPKVVTALLLQRLPAEDVQEVFDHGTPGQLSCSLNRQILNCGSVSFNLGGI